MTRRSAHATATMLAFGASTAFVPGAFAQSPHECAAAYQSTQAARRDGHLVRARREALACAAAACPAHLVRDCTTAAAELEALIPTVIIDVQSEDETKIADATFTIDGETERHPAGGRALAVDPGQHIVHVVAPGWQPGTVRFTSSERERDLRVVVTLARTPAAVAAKPTTQPASPDDGEPMLAYVAAGVGGFALAGAAFFGWQGLGIRRDLNELGCKPNCPSAQVDEMRTDFLLADILLGTSLVSLAGALYLFLAPNEDEGPRPTGAAKLTIVPTGLGGAVVGRF